MTMRDECMALNRMQRALMLQMNVVDRRIDQKVRLLLRLEKFAADRGRATEPDGRRERAMSTKKRYSTIFS
jgi:hypothetical protein